MDTLAQDFRYALRQLTRTPAFTLVAVLTLAIGIGANTALFTLANAVLARTAPGVLNTGRLVWITPFNTRGGHGEVMAYPDFADYRDASGVFEDAAAFGNVEFSVSGGGQPVRLRGQIVSGSYFSVLGVRMAMGRAFTAEEDGAPAAHPVAVVSYHMWQERLNADPNVVGRRLVIDGTAFTIVGVAAERFSGADLDERQREIWVPMAMQPVVAPTLALSDRNAWWLSAVGTLKPNISIARAQAAVATVAARIAAADSANHAFTTATVAPVRGGVRQSDMNDIVPVATLAAVATGLILLIACANVSNMLLGRAVGRRREIGVRLSLGATRGRLVRQLLTESVLLAAAASVCGLILSTWATDVLTSVALPFVDVTPEGHTIAFALAAAVATGMLFGVVPALHATRTDLVSALKDSTLGFDRRRSRLQGGFVVAQVSLSLVLLIMSGMFLAGLYRAARVQVGFEATSHVLAASFDLDLQGYTPERAATLISTLESQAAELPGVTDVSVTNSVPMGERRIGADIALDPKESDQAGSFGNRGMEVYDNVVRPRFFRTLGIGVVAGRDFETTDVAGSAGVIVVSEDFARRAWPGTNALGKHVSVSGAKGPYLTVVGVVRTALTFGLGERTRPIVYRSSLQFPKTRDATLLVRNAGDATVLAPAVRRLIHALDSNLPIYAMQSLGQYRRDRLSDMAFGSTLLGIIGALAVLLASVGLYAVVAFAVGQRTREIGIRIALGAAQRSVVRMFVAQGLRVTMVGLAVGLVLSAAVVKVLASAFVGVTAADGLTFVAVASLLAIVATVASWIPARRAARVDPMVALRSE